MKYATHMRNKYLRNRTMQNTSNILGGKLASIIWNNSEIKDSFCSLIVWHVKFNLLFKTSLDFVLHQLFWIILSSKKGAVGCECQVDSLLDQSFYMGSQTKDLYSATRPRHFLLLRSISSSSQKNKLWFLRNMTRWYFELQKARTVAQIFTTFIFIRKMRKI